MYQALKSLLQVGEALYQLLGIYNWTYENRIGDKQGEVIKFKNA